MEVFRWREAASMVFYLPGKAPGQKYYFKIWGVMKCFPKELFGISWQK